MITETTLGDFAMNSGGAADTFPDNKVNTEDLTIQPTAKPSKKRNKTVAKPDLDILSAGTVTNASTERDYMLAPKQDDTWSLYEATIGSAARGAESSILGTGLSIDAEMTQQDPETVSSAGFRQMLPNFFSTYQADAEDRQAIIESNLPSESFNALFRNVQSKEELHAKIKVLSKNQTNTQLNQEQGLTGQIFGGVGDAIGDPFSYLGGAALSAAQKTYKGSKILNHTLGSRLLESSVSAGLSESLLRNQITGQESDVEGAMIGAVVLTGGLHGLGKGWDMAQARITGSETARHLNKVDPTVKPNDNLDDIDLDGGDTVELSGSGKVMSSGIVPPKASTSGRFWKQDLATVAANAEDEATRSLAALLTRPTQGYTEDFRMETPNAESIYRTLNNRSLDLMRDIQETLDDLTERSSLLGGGISNREAYGRRIAHAVQGYELDVPLNKVEKQLVETIRQRLQEQADNLQNPSRLSGKEAPSVHDGFIDDGTYIPRVYNRTKLNRLISKHGKEAVQKAFSDSWKEAYHLSGENKAGYDAAILKDYEGQTTVTPEMLEDYTMRKAYGVVSGDEGHFDTDMFTDGTGTSKTLDYFKHRVPLATNGKATLGDDTFSIDDVVDYNLERVLGTYFRSTNGRLATTAATGMDGETLGKTIAALPDSDGKKALEGLTDVFNGQARTDYDMGDLIADTLRDSTFSLMNGMMWVGNALEGLGNATKRGIIPAAAKHFAKALGKDLEGIKKMSRKEVQKEFEDVIVGTSIVNRMNLTYNDWYDGLVQRMGKSEEDLGFGFNVAARARYASMVASERSPFTHLLNRTQEAFVNAGNHVGMGELISHAKGKTTTSMMNPKFLQSNGIPQEVADRAIAFLKETVNDSKTLGEPRDGVMDASDFNRDSWLNDPRTADVERLLQAYNDEILMKADNVGQQYFKPAGAMGRLLLQFKRFATTSTQYLTKTGKDLKNMRGESYVGLLLAGGMSYAYNVGTIHYKALYMNDRKRKEYLEDNLQADKLAAATLRRIPVLAGWSLGYDMANVVSPFELPYAGLGKTTVDSDLSKELKTTKPTSMYEYGSRLTGNVRNMFPAARLPIAAGASAINAGKLGLDLVDDRTLMNHQSRRIQRTLARDLQTFVPNSPALRATYHKINEQFGIDMDKK